MSKKEIVNEAGIVVGDFFVCSWGYDQTNIDYYKVIEVTPKGVKVQAWKSARESGEGTYDKVVAGDGPRTHSRCTLQGEAFYAADYWTRQEHTVTEDAPIKFHKINGATREDARFTVSSYSSAHLWSGSAQYETAAGFGH